MFLPPPRSIDDTAWCITAQHHEGGTWTAIGRTIEEASASLSRQQKHFPHSYVQIGPVLPARVVKTEFGLIWGVPK
jgi:hypothetical protein